MTRTLVPLKQAAAHVNRDERTLQRWVHAGHLTAYPDGTGRRLVCLQEAIALEADIRMRLQNKQRQQLMEIFGPETAS